MGPFSRKAKKTDDGAEIVLLVEGMHCTSCGLLIDDRLADVPGVRSASTDVRAGRTTVRLAEGTPDVATAALLAAVAGAGEYTARLAD